MNPWRVLVPLLVAVAFAGCDKDTPPAPCRFAIGASDITATTVTVNIVPTNPEQPYLKSYFDEKQYAEYGTDEGIRLFVGNLLDNLGKKYPELSREEIVFRLAYAGTTTGSHRFLMPATPYYLYAVGVDAHGNVNSGFFSERFVTTEAQGASPEVRPEITAGDRDGENRTSRMNGMVKASGVSYGKGYFERKHDIDSLVETGLDYRAIVKTSGRDFSPSELDGMNGDGMRYSFSPLRPATEYMFLTLVVSEGGRSAVAYATASTDAAEPEPVGVCKIGEVSENTLFPQNSAAIPWVN